MTEQKTLADILAEGPEWQDRPDRPKIEPARWGKDHWSLLLYVEDAVVNAKGRLDWRRIGISARGWPTLYAARDMPRFTGHTPTPGRYTSPFSGEDQADEYGLRLKFVDGKPVQVCGVCEIDALMDLVDAGLVLIEMPRVSEDGNHYLKPNGRPLADPHAPVPGDLVTGFVEQQLMPWAKFRLTRLGRAVASEAREHASLDGAKWSDFKPQAMDIPDTISGTVLPKGVEA